MLSWKTALKMFCTVCGDVDEHYDEYTEAIHFASPKHKSNMILANYKANKDQFVRNKDGISIHCNAKSYKYNDAPVMEVQKNDKQKTRINAKPNQAVNFSFDMSSNIKNEDILIVGVQLAHPQPQFQMNNHCYVFGAEPNVLKSQSSIINEVIVKFVAQDIGQYEMPIMFTFHRVSISKNIIIIREMVVMVQEAKISVDCSKSPFTNKSFPKAKNFIHCTDKRPFARKHKIPKPLKMVFPLGLDEDALEKMKASDEKKAELRKFLIKTRTILDEGINDGTYRKFFHALLWWEETIARINIKKYNMTGITLVEGEDNTYWIEVPGLAEKRPSLMRGDRVFLRPIDNLENLFESVIANVKDSSIQVGKLDERFDEYYSPEVKFHLRFLLNRVPMERMHAAVDNIFTLKQECRIFPYPLKKVPTVKPIHKFYNKLVEQNLEQRSAVEHILARTSGQAPYIVFGPPGTGKTITIVEAIIQIVVQNPKHRVLVCTDSNMAADHIALTLLRYTKVLKIEKFILRANSETREWSIMPPELIPISNGSRRENFRRLDNVCLSMYRIVVTTLLHSAKYASDLSQLRCRLRMSHVFVDEAAQALEPAALVPLGLLARAGQLVLAGDPQQLGPICLSRDAKAQGLGLSLLERLWTNYKNLYEHDPNYITTLVQNYRSDPDILQIPNELFYIEKPLQPRAKPDPLSKVSVLGLPGGERAVVFHSVNSREQRMGNAPSYFNEKELDMLQRYTRALVQNHNVSPKDIGIISPYIRQVYKIRDWLKQKQFEEVEVGTVESFQGKEKRAILVSTVRANCHLLDYDRKYSLGFLVDDKRFNVALTRAKAKLIIIGNPACLVRDVKWRIYMDFCKMNDCYFGQETEQLDRSAALLTDISRTRFDMCRLTEALDTSLKEFEEKQNKNK